MAGVYIEDTIITLPSIKDGVDGLGDLWNCHESKVCGFNLFDKPLEKVHLIDNPIGKNEYSLIHIKNTADLINNIKLSGSLKIELLSGLIPVEASAGFNKSSTKNSNEEQLICKYFTETYSVKLRPSSAKGAMDEYVTKQIIDGKIKATHVVGGVILGGEVNAHLNIKQTNTDSLVDITGDVVGNFIYGPINGTVKANLMYLDDEKASDYEKHITINSKPPMRDQPTSIEQMFKVIESIDQKISDEQHFDMIGKNIYGIPIRYILVPITQFVEVDIEKLYMQLNDDIQDNLCSMLILLHDYRMTGYVTNMVIDKLPRLRFILSDKNSQLTRDISSYETVLKLNSNTFFKRAFEMIKKFKIKQCEVDELLKIVDAFSISEFNQFNVESKIASFVDQGSKELIGIHDKDAIEMNAIIIRFTNKTALQEWFQTETKIKLLLYTSGSCPDGVFKRLFEMSSALKKINSEIAVALPSISDEFSLIVKVETNTATYKADDILFTLGIVCAIIGHNLGTESYFHVLNALTYDITLPLKDKNMNDIINVISTLSMNKAVFITRSLAHLIQNTINPSLDNKWKFFICLDAIDTAINALEKLKKYMSKWSTMNCEWIAGTVGISNMNASPLLYVFYNSNLEAIVYDNIDYLVLDRLFQSKEFLANPKSNSILSPEISTLNSYYPDQSRFAVNVVNRVARNDNPKFNSYNFGMSAFKEIYDQNINSALKIARYAVTKNNVEVISVVAYDALTSFSDLEFIFKPYGFSGATKRFNNLDSAKLCEELEKWLNLRDPFVAKIYSAILAIKHTTDDAVTDSLIKEVIDDKSCPENLKTEVNMWKRGRSSFGFGKIGYILEEFTQNSEFKQTYLTIIALITLLKQDIESKNENGLDVYEILPPYIDRIISSLNSKYYSSLTKLKEYISTRKSYHLIALLAKHKYDGYLREFHLLLDLITDLDNSIEFIDFVNMLYCIKFEESHYKELWKNLKFQHLISIGIENKDVMKCVLKYIQNSSFDTFNYITTPTLANRLKSELDKLPKISLKKILTTFKKPHSTNLKPVIMDGIYVEDTIITLPSIKDGVKKLGDLWNCHESKVCEFNLFGKPLEKVHLIDNAIGKNEYSLIHINNTADLINNINLSGLVKIELLSGLIAVEASAGFDNVANKISNEELLICKYYTETYSVKLKPSRGKEAMNDYVTKQIKDGKIKATHVVGGVILGGEVNAHLNIKQIKTDSVVDIKGDIVEKLIFGPINGTVKANLKYLDDEKASDYEKHITINSKPPMKDQPTSVEQMFKVIESIDQKISEEKHFDMIGKKIYGIPIRYILVPITQFLEVDIEKLYMQLKDDIQDNLCSMLTLLHDYRMTGYVTNMVIDKLPRLRFLISDKNSQLSGDISSYETELKLNSDKYFKRAFDSIKKFKIKQCEVNDLLKIVEDFSKSELNQFNVERKIASFVKQGAKELISVYQVLSSFKLNDK